MFNIFDIPPADDAGLPLTTSPWPVLLILSAYLFFVLKLGKDFMELRQPYNLKKFMLIYNSCQVVINAMLFYSAIYWLVYRRIFDFRCLITLEPDNPLKNLERTCSYIYYLNKYMDLVDTIIFVLRKSNKQISFLHVYHHLFMTSGGYLVIRFYGYGGQLFVLGMLNTLVHTIMYAYYFLCAWNPQHKQSIWWKKYITCLQMLQFFIVFSYAFYVYIFQRSCPYPKFLQYTNMLQSLVMMYMFGKFYVQAYCRAATVKEQ